MQLFYTGAQAFLQSQTNPFYSLGGFVSNTPLANGQIGNIFSDISRYSEEFGNFEVKAIALINTRGSAVSGPITLYFDYPKSSTVDFSLPDLEANGFFSVAGASGEDVKLTIPSVGLSSAFEALRTRISAGKVSVGDFFTVSLTDGGAPVSTVLYVSEIETVGSDFVIWFAPPNYATLGLAFATTELAEIMTSYVFSSNILTNRAKFEVAPVTLLNNQRMEVINSSQSLPFAGTFIEPHGSGNKVVIANSLAPNAGVGIWVKKSITLPDPLDAVACEDLKVYLAGLTKQEEIKVIIEYP
jgi:hypothetical protein